MRKAIEEYEMIKENDKIAICLSGGKDSITMLSAFKALQRFYPKKFDIMILYCAVMEVVLNGEREEI